MSKEKMAAERAELLLSEIMEVYCARGCDFEEPRELDCETCPYLEAMNKASAAMFDLEGE